MNPEVLTYKSREHYENAWGRLELFRTDERGRDVVRLKGVGNNDPEICALQSGR